MIDIKLVRDEPDRVRASQLARGEDPGIVDAILAADERRRSSLGEFESLRAEQKAVSKGVGAAMAAFQKARKAGAPDADHLEETAHTARTKAARLSDEVKTLESSADAAGAELTRLLRMVGNVIIDGCETCNLVWLDFGELKQIADAPGPDRGVRKVQARPTSDALMPAERAALAAEDRPPNLLDVLLDLL